MRQDNRHNDELRQITIERNYIKYPQGSVLISFGDTKLICTAMVEEKVPPFLKNTGKGWITAEYNMLPAANAQRKKRDIAKLKVDGRSAEIQRLIGRSLRSVVDLQKLGERTIWIDCDVIQADGSTRCTAITGGFIALYDAVRYLLEQNIIDENPIREFAAAVSVGVVCDEIMTDLCYEEDSSAIADMNVVMSESEGFIEIQATGEQRPVRVDEMQALLAMAQKSVLEIIEVQKKVLGV